MEQIELTTEEYLNTLLYIKDRESFKIMPFCPNPIQMLYLKNATLRDIILKSRRVGISTVIAGDFFSEQQTSSGIEAKVVAHTSDSTRYLLEMVRLFYLQLPVDPKPRVENFNMNAITFPDIHASYTIQTAGAKNPGLATAIHRLHCSEIAFWEDDPEKQFKGLSECVPSTGKIRKESTPNGQGNMFHKDYVDAKMGLTAYRAHFFAWFLDPGYALDIDSPLTLPADRSKLEYTDEETKLLLANGLTEEQIRWRRWKIGELGDLFPQLYPEDDVSCFLITGNPYFDKVALLKLVKRAPKPIEVTQEGTGEVRTWEKPDPKERYALGADASEGIEGGDRACAFIYSLNSGKQALTLHGLWSPGEFAALINKYGRMYNNAYAGIEAGVDKWGSLVLQYLVEHFSYPNLHYHPYGDKMQEVKVGYPTTSLAKATADSELNDAIKANELEIRDKEVLGEMGSYVRHATGKIEAASGTHDDLVSAAKIAWQMRKYAPTRPIQTVEVGTAPRYAQVHRGPPAFRKYLEKLR